MKVWKKFYYFIMVLVLAAFTSISSTSLSSQPSDENVNINFDDLNASLEKMNDMWSQTRAVKDYQRILDLRYMIKNAISEETIDVHHVKIDFGHATYLDFTKDEVDYTAVTIPGDGDKFDFISNLTLVFDQNKNIVNYSETLIRKKDDDTFKYTSYADGERVQHEVKDIGYDNRLVDKGLEELRNDQPINHKDTTKCIAAVLGVGTAVAALIAYVCAGSCVVPVSAPICAACIGAYAVVGGGSITAMANCF